MLAQPASSFVVADEMTASSFGGSEDSLAQSMEEDKYSSPSEERERINRLEIAVTWIKQAVENLRESDRLIYQEFEKVRSAIHEIRDARLQEEKKLNAERLFDEYFGTFLRRKKGVIDDTERPPSLHVPKVNPGRNYSQTLV